MGTRCWKPVTSSRMQHTTAASTTTIAAVSTHQRLLKMRNFFCSSIWAAKKQITPIMIWQRSRLNSPLP